MNTYKTRWTEIVNKIREDSDFKYTFGRTWFAFDESLDDLEVSDADRELIFDFMANNPMLHEFQMPFYGTKWSKDYELKNDVLKHGKLNVGVFLDETFENYHDEELTKNDIQSIANILCQTNQTYLKPWHSELSIDYDGGESFFLSIMRRANERAQIIYNPSIKEWTIVLCDDIGDDEYTIEELQRILEEREHFVQKFNLVNQVLDNMAERVTHDGLGIILTRIHKLSEEIAYRIYKEN